ncbi:hypothetical protein [Paenibacillus sp. IITD108]|uniref:hypothetical protein n=1 Tax=Paenibacillus sp. IITD108 TaxID=3116649 RepID=UPI002F426B00
MNKWKGIALESQGRVEEQQREIQRSYEIIKGLEEENVALKADRDDFKHGHIMLQKENAVMKNYLLELQRVTPYALIREQISHILADISKEATQ